MNKITNLLQHNWLLPVILLLGIGFRLLAATRGHNYDVDSYLVVADIMEQGDNVYAHTTRYNYGPVWFNLLAFLNGLASPFFPNQELAFRYILVGFLSLVDVGIFAILWHKFGRIVAYLFFLNPISILITGFHSQFDNLAVFLGLLAVVILGDEFHTPLNRRKGLGLLFLGLSLMTKHILFAFPFWLAVKQKGIWQKLWLVLLPAFLFFLSFVPYWGEGQTGILQNVIFYNSWNNEVFYQWFIPRSIQIILTSQMVWLALLALFAVVFRQRNAIDSLLIYTCVLVAASPAIANQYLTIPIPFVAAFMNPFLALYSLMGGVYLLLYKNGLYFYPLENLINISQTTYYAILITPLWAGFFWFMWRDGIMMLCKRVIDEARGQLGHQG